MEYIQHGPIWVEEFFTEQPHLFIAMHRRKIHDFQKFNRTLKKGVPHEKR